MKPQLSYKIKIYCRVYLFTILGLCYQANAQNLVVIKNTDSYWQEVEKDSLKKMIEIKSLAPSIRYDLRYATKGNFTKQQLYKSGKSTFLRHQPAYALKKVQDELETKGYGLKIFDAYRPYSATKKMWELIHDERYVANPSKGSGHNRGLAVDLTIVELKSGKEIDMGTGFDNFTDTANQNFKGLSTEIIENRKLLKQTMENFGFKVLETEWWHYSWANDRNYEVLDIDFKKLRKEHD